MRSDPDQKVQTASTGGLGGVVGGQQAEQPGEKRHGQVHRIDVGCPVGDDVDKHQSHRVVTNIVTLRHPGAELTGAQVTHQPATETALGAQHGIDHGPEHGLERHSLLANDQCRSGNAALLDEEQFTQNFVLAGEMYVERAAGHPHAFGDGGDLGFGEAASFELLDGLVEKPRPGGLALSRTGGGGGGLGGVSKSWRWRWRHDVHTNAR